MAGILGWMNTLVLYFLLLSNSLVTVLADVPSSSFVASPGNNNISLAINVPTDNSTQDLFFHFEAPSRDHMWAGFGIGSGMSGSLIFVVYRPENNEGTQPIVSTRIGFSHAMPQYTNDVNVTLMDGSVVTSERFSVNFQCKDCRSWSGGSIHTQSTSQDFFFALGPNDPLESNDENASINKHEMIPIIFSLNLEDANGAGGIPTIGSADDHEEKTVQFGLNGLYPLLAFHGFIMSLAFLIVFPIGYLFLRLFGKVWLHASFQTIGILLVIAGVGSGIAGSKKYDISPNLTNSHQIIGLVVAGLALLTYSAGIIGHSLYKKRGVPSAFMKSHRFLGPSTILIAYVNACIGLNWIGAPRAIGLFLGIGVIVWLIIGALVLLKKRRNRSKQAFHSKAAQNFRDGASEPLYDQPPAQASHPDGVHGYSGLPMQNMDTEYSNGK